MTSHTRSVDLLMPDVSDAVSDLMNAMTQRALHRLRCDGTCADCAAYRHRSLLRQFAVAGEDDSCPDCGSSLHRAGITDEVEEVIA